MDRLGYFHRLTTLIAKRGYCATFIVVLVAGVSLPTNAQKLQFRQLTPDNGLSSSLIQTIVQDGRGFMWFGTRKGLNRYDGTGIKVFRHRASDTTSIADSRVDDAFEDAAKTLWLGTAVGLSRYDPARDAFTNYAIVPGVGVLVNVIAEAQGILWLGTERGIFQFDRARGTMQPFRADLFAGQDVMSIYEDRSRHLWFGTRTDGAYELDSQSRTIKHWAPSVTGLPGKDARAFVDDGAGSLWIGLVDAGLVRLDRTTGKMTRYRHAAADPNSLSIDAVHVLLLDSTRGLWVGTENGGLDYLDFATLRFEHNQFDPSNPWSLSSNSIWALHRDPSGLLWVGTFAGGLNISRQNGNAIRRFHSLAGDPTSLSFNSVVSLQEGLDGAMWVATDGGGLNRLDRATGKFKRYTMQTSNLNSDAVLSIAEDKVGHLWIGTWRGGISRFDPRSGRFTPYTTKNSGLAEDGVFAVHVDKAGQLWIGTDTKGLQRLDPERGTFTSYHVTEGEGGQIRIITEASDGMLFLGTVMRGLVAFDPKTGASRWYKAGKDGISSNLIRAVLETEPGIIWVGTASGLDRIDRHTNTIQHFTEANGLPEGGVSGLVMDSARDLWVSGDRGITRFDPAMKKRTVYTVGDGLQGSEFSPGATYRTRDGTLYFGGSQGFNAIRPDGFTKNEHVPPVVFTGFQLANKPVTIGGIGSPLKANISVAKQVTLDHDQSVFTLEFAALDYAAPDKNRYTYKLEGLDPEWNDIGKKRSATYTNVQPGHYTFRVKASNNDGVWNDQGASIEIDITPPFWKTWWFRTLAGLALLAILVAIVRSAQQRHRALKAINAELGRVSEHDRESQQYLESNVLDILDAMQRFSAGDYAVALDVNGDDAIGKLRLGFNSVVADRKRAEEELRQSQKMEAVGRLAGGVAHDFNNLLTVIKGNAALGLEDLETKETSKQAVREELVEIERAADRATELTRQLLAFSRKQILKPQALSLNDMVSNVGRMLRRTLGEDIALEIVLEPTLGVAQADPGQIEQVLLNLVVNARDAMPRGGMLLIETRNVSAKEVKDYAESEDVPYVAIVVTDTGTGMEADVRDRVFEPFFTTKEQGKGTGLGLSTVYGSVKQSGGFVVVESEVGKGSSFSIYLPRVRETLRQDVETKVESGPVGTATVLLVEDEEALRRLSSRVLTRAGYLVLTAACGADAMMVAEQFDGTIDLLLTDVVMPGMSGRELAELLVPRRPGMRLLYVSGYTEDATIRHGVSSEETAFLGKPFTPTVLLKKVQEVLDAAPVELVLHTV